MAVWRRLHRTAHREATAQVERVFRVSKTTGPILNAIQLACYHYPKKYREEFDAALKNELRAYIHRERQRAGR